MSDASDLELARARRSAAQAALDAAHLELLEEVRRLFVQGMGVTELAALSGLARQSLYAIISREGWHRGADF